jgi:hypothetical protein
MINDWLSYIPRDAVSFSSFRLVDVAERKAPDERIRHYLAREVLGSYRNLDFLKRSYQHADAAALRDYLAQHVFPADTSPLVRNVRQGDFGEILASLIVSFFEQLVVPIHKMSYKFNKDRSVFCTDMLAHNAGPAILRLFYYEIKTRQTIQLEGTSPDRHFVTVHAHNSLLKDQQTPNESIADFLAQRYFDMEDFDNAAKYHDIVLNSTRYTKQFELYFIIERNSYNEDILHALQSLPPTLHPLGVTVVLIDNFHSLLREVFEFATDIAISHVFPPQP